MLEMNYCRRLISHYYSQQDVYAELRNIAHKTGITAAHDDAVPNLLHQTNKLNYENYHSLEVPITNSQTDLNVY